MRALLETPEPDPAAYELGALLGARRRFVAVPLGVVNPEASLPRTPVETLALFGPDDCAFVAFGLEPVPGGVEAARALLAEVDFDARHPVAPALALSVPFEGEGAASAVPFVPKVALRVVGGQAYLTSFAPRAERESVEALARQVLTSLSRGPRTALPRVESRVSDDRETFLVRVQRARDAVLGGELDKVVLARRVELRLSAPADVAALLLALRLREPSAIRYAFAHGADLRVGATPERLFTIADGLVTTEAVAGTSSSSGGAELLASAKDAEEHRAVVEDIAERLQPFVDGLVSPDRPEVRRLRDVAHLVTPFAGRLARGASPFDLLALHPTPAVLGSPRAAARTWIDAVEPFSRGSYAAPLGWVDARGDAQVVVALRGASFDGARAILHAGAGIVRGSIPERELEETELKLRTILRAFDGARA